MDLREFKELEGAMTEFEKAAEIASMWNRHRAENRGRGKLDFRKWANENLGNGKSHDVRQQLYNRGAWVKPLWDAVDEEMMPVSTALKLAREAEKMGGSIDENLRAVLTEYNDREFVRKTPDGRVIRQKKPAPRSKQTFKAERVDTSHVLQGGKDLWVALSELGDEYAKGRLPDVDELERRRLTGQFMRGLRIVFEDFTRDVSNAKRRNRAGAKVVSKRSVRVACNILGVPYRDGKTPDMTLANRRYKILAARMHPDSNNGSEEMLEQYHAVNEAWQILKEASDAG